MSIITGWMIDGVMHTDRIAADRAYRKSPTAAVTVVYDNPDPKPLRPYCQVCGWRKGGRTRGMAWLVSAATKSHRSNWRNRPAVISLLKLEMHQRRLRQMIAELHDAYPDAEGDMASNIFTDIHETIRNVQTADVHLLGWINFRKNHRRDPRYNE